MKLSFTIYSSKGTATAGCCLSLFMDHQILDFGFKACKIEGQVRWLDCVPAGAQSGAKTDSSSKRRRGVLSFDGEQGIGHVVLTHAFEGNGGGSLLNCYTILMDVMLAQAPQAGHRCSPQKYLSHSVPDLTKPVCSTQMVACANECNRWTRQHKLFCCDSTRRDVRWPPCGSANERS